jgi:sigma-E factor negative regulatory protein RseC
MIPMIEESALVVKVEEEGFAWVETTRASACGGCAERHGCGTSALAGVLGRRQAPVRVINSVGAAVGERVVIGLPESGLLRGSLAVYAAPLAGLFTGGLTGQFLGAGVLQGHADFWSVLLGAGGFSVALLWLRRFSRVSARDGRYQPLILRRTRAVSKPRHEVL